MRIYKNIEFDEICKIAGEFGILADLDEYGNKLLDISPNKSRTTNTLSTRYGMGEFPFHTDTAYWKNPAKFILLYCKNKGSGYRKTRIIHIDSIIDGINITNKFFNSLFLVNRFFNSFYVKPLILINNVFHIRFDQNCMIPKNLYANEVIEIMNNLDQNHSITEISWEEKDLLILDNHSYLHARGKSFTFDTDRILTRGLIK